MDIKIIAVIIVFYINLLEFGECSFFQVEIAPATSISSKVSRRSVLSSKSDSNAQLEDTQDSATHGPRKRRKGHKSNQTRNGHKKPGKAHRKRNKTRHAKTTTTKAPMNLFENSNVDLFDLQELSPTDSKQFSIPVINSEDKFISSNKMKEDTVHSSGRSAVSGHSKASKKEFKSDDARSANKHPPTKPQKILTRSDPVIEGNDMIASNLPGKRSYSKKQSSKMRLTNGAKGRAAEDDANDSPPEESEMNGDQHEMESDNAPGPDDNPEMSLRSDSGTQGDQPDLEHHEEIKAMNKSENSTKQRDELGPLIDFPFDDDGDGDGNETDTKKELSLEEYDALCNTKENEMRKRKCETPLPFVPNDEENEDYKADTKINPFNLAAPADDPVISDRVVTGLIHDVAKTNRKLIVALITMAIFPTPEYDSEPKNGFKFLNTTRTIFNKICPPHVVQPKFLQSVVHAFKILHDITTPNRQPFINDVEYGLIDEILQECSANAKPADYIQNECKEEVVAVNKTSNLLCLGQMTSYGRKVSTACFQSNVEVFDPVLDIVWLMFEAVKSYCFDNFQGNIRHLHRYSAAMMDLYSKPLKFRWALQREDKEFWERTLGPGVTLALGNIDKCAHHIIHIGKLNFRTPRFFNVHSIRISNTFTDFLVK